MKNDNLKNETPAFGNVLLPAVLLDEIIKYIEEREETFDGEWGSSRSVEKLIEHNCMPELYAKMLALKMAGNGRAVGAVSIINTKIIKYMNAKDFLAKKGVHNLDTKKRYNEVIAWMEEYAASATAC